MSSMLEVDGHYCEVCDRPFSKLGNFQRHKESKAHKHMETLVKGMVKGEEKREE